MRLLIQHMRLRLASLFQTVLVGIRATVLNPCSSTVYREEQYGSQYISFLDNLRLSILLKRTALFGHRTVLSLFTDLLISTTRQIICYKLCVMGGVIIYSVFNLTEYAFNAM